MTEIERLEMLVKHYEIKEKKLIASIEMEIEEVDKIIKNIDAYKLKTYWVGYKKALKLVLKQIDKLERVAND